MASNDFFTCSIGKQTIPEVEATLDSSDEHGADIRFHGVVRKTEDEREISAIDYSFYEGMAEAELSRIGEAMLEEHPGHRAMVYHRVGPVLAGDASILIRVQTVHSALAFTLIKRYLEEIKTSVPIWKKPIYIEK